MKAEIAANYKKAKVSQEMQGLADKAQAELKKDPLHPEKVAAELHLDFAKADNVGPGDPLPQVGVSKDFDESLNGLKAGEISQPIALARQRRGDGRGHGRQSGPSLGIRGSAESGPGRADQ